MCISKTISIIYSRLESKRPTYFAGRITFSDDITVTGTEGVVMTPSAIINSIDPRSLLRDNMDILTIKSDCRFTNPLKVRM